MTANKMYKQYKKSGGTLVFKDWLDREKKKNFLNFEGQSTVPVNKPLTDSINQALDELHKESGLKTGLENKYIFGLNKNIWIAAGIATVIIVGVVVYNKTKK